MFQTCVRQDYKGTGEIQHAPPCPNKQQLIRTQPINLAGHNSLAAPHANAYFIPSACPPRAHAVRMKTGLLIHEMASMILRKRNFEPLDMVMPVETKTTCLTTTTGSYTRASSATARSPGITCSASQYVSTRERADGRNLAVTFLFGSYPLRPQGHTPLASPALSAGASQRAEGRRGAERGEERRGRRGDENPAAFRYQNWWARRARLICSLDPASVALD